MADSIMEKVRQDLTPDARTSYHNRLVEVIHEQEELEVELAGVKEVFKGRRTALETEQHTLKEKLRNGYEMIEVECVWEMDARRGVAWLVRLDTGKRLRSRSMTDDEKQARLPFKN